jgi:hypothetical protein
MESRVPRPAARRFQVIAGRRQLGDQGVGARAAARPSTSRARCEKLFV